MVLIASADLHLREGNVDAAERALDELGRAVDGSAEAQLLRARLLLATGKTLAAMRTLGAMEASCHSQGQSGTMIRVHLLHALGHRANGGRAATLERLEQAVSLAAAGGYVRPFLEADAALAGLLRHVSHVAPAFVNGLLEFFRQPSHADVPVEPTAAGLTRTQLEVLRLVGQGHGNQQIAAQLVITVGTAKWHVSQIFEKLGVRNRAQAIARARESKLL
jgi:LuxR family maltose regulon positive regulatory protein